MPTFRDRVVDFCRVRAGDLEPHPQNWRRHPERQSVAMLGVLADIGFADVLLVRRLPTGRYQLLDGHLRAETAPDMEVPCAVLDLDDHEAVKLLVTHDPIASMAEQDSRALAELLAQLEHAGALDTARLVWPDYIINPLQTATWAPAEQTALDSGGAAHPLALTPEQRSIVDEAIARCRAETGEETDGACLAWICRAYLTTAVAA
jgi:ParB-like nuclease domain